jgi:hypothetical protein
MFEVREVMSLLLATGVVIFILLQLDLLKQVQRWHLLITAFLLLYASLACSVIEGVIWEEGLNTIQHLCSGLSAVFLAIWTWSVFHAKEGLQ